MLEYASVLHFSLSSNSIPLYGYITFVFIHLPADGHFNCFQFGAILNNAPMSNCIRIFCMDTLSFLLDRHLGVDLMSNEVH